MKSRTVMFISIKPCAGKSSNWGYQQYIRTTMSFVITDEWQRFNTRATRICVGWMASHHGNLAIEWPSYTVLRLFSGILDGQRRIVDLRRTTLNKYIVLVEIPKRIMADLTEGKVNITETNLHSKIRLITKIVYIFSNFIYCVLTDVLYLYICCLKYMYKNLPLMCLTYLTLIHTDNLSNTVSQDSRDEDFGEPFFPKYL